MELCGYDSDGDGSGVYNYRFDAGQDDKIAVYISGASEKGATITFTSTSDIATRNIYENELVVFRTMAAQSKREPKECWGAMIEPGRRQ
jgi:hypothetical protein